MILTAADDATAVAKFGLPECWPSTTSPAMTTALRSDTDATLDGMVGNGKLSGAAADEQPYSRDRNKPRWIETRRHLLREGGSGGGLSQTFFIWLERKLVLDSLGGIGFAEHEGRRRAAGAWRNAVRSDDALRHELVAANHVLAHENILDVFGHVSMRDPAQPEQYLLSRACSPANVTFDDIQLFTLDSQPLDPTAPSSYSERVIHGNIYRLRPDVQAVCHFHTLSVMPFCITDTDLIPVSHVGATMGRQVSRWNSQDEFGDTDLLVSTNEQGLSLARALGPNWAVLMQNHGVTSAGRSLREAVFRTIQICRNAELQLSAMRLGALTPLTEKEIELAGEFNLREPVIRRAWEYWLGRLAQQPPAGA
jgi:ribulose-5-phosphate 4-epimerase/fuculose-1-phosphate aldolase